MMQLAKFMQKIKAMCSAQFLTDFFTKILQLFSVHLPARQNPVPTVSQFGQ